MSEMGARGGGKIVTKNKDHVVVDEPMYQTVFVISALQDLKEKGLVEGGYEIIKKAEMAELLRIGKQRGFKEPNKKQVTQIMDSLQNRMDKK